MMKTAKRKAPAKPLPDEILGRFLQDELEKYNTEGSPIKLTRDTRLVLRLIYEDLKVYKVFGAFREIGFEEDFYQPSLYFLVFNYAGLTDKIKDSPTFYDNLMWRHSKKMEADRCDIARAAIAVYRKLMAKGKR